MDDIVSEFIVRTCRMFPKSNNSVFESMLLQDFTKWDKYLIVCGSCAEFFIQPLHSCIGDVDYFETKQHSLAFTNENLVLPYDVRHITDTIDCLLMEPYLDYPAFVRLRLMGQMKYNWERKTFEFTTANVQKLIKTTEMDENDTDDEEWIKVGPASRGSVFDICSLSVDIVESIWCPQWPQEAKDWPSRRRNYGWPTTDNIRDIVQNGCHVVLAKHPACRNDIHQCRLSFSVAEVLLLQSWTPVQQIVYNMIRFFAKRELIKKDCLQEDEVLRTYHFKTLMLWSCEKMSKEWWNSSSVIEVCCNLLKILAKWLKETKCPHYFISLSNLFHENFNQKIVDETAIMLDYFCNSNNLRLWFVEHYMQPSFFYVSDAKWTYDVLSCEYVVHTCEAMKGINLKSIDFYFSIRFWLDVECVRSSLNEGFVIVVLDFVKYSLRAGSPLEDKLDLLPFAECESCFLPYESMLLILCAASLLQCKEIYRYSGWFVEIISQIFIKPKRLRSKHHNLPRPLNTDIDASQLYFLNAQKLMENLTGSSADLEFQIVSEISKGLLRKAFECVDSKINTISKSTLFYMAALHFAASEYQVVISLCSRVTMNEKPEKEDTETLNAGCLLYIEDISKIIGFYLIFRKTKGTYYHYLRRQFFLDLRLKPEVFAQYLKISSIERTVGAFGPNIVSQTPTFPLDAILMNITNRRASRLSKKTRNVLRVYQRIDPISKVEASNEIVLPNEDNIIQLLMNYSLENMTTFYNAVCKDFGIHCSTVDCYRAAYLYQRRKYPEVLQLCERILNKPDLQSDLKELSFANVMVMPPLDSFFDRDIQCLLGFHTLVCYLSPLNDDLVKIEVSEMSTFQQFFTRNIYCESKSLSRVLLEPYSIKCHYFLRRHFLANYLNVRCLIDCNQSFSKVMFEFKKLEVCLPLEYTIRCFLGQRLRQLQKNVDAKCC